MTTTPSFSRPVRESGEKRATDGRATGGKRIGASLHGRGSLRTVRDVEKGIPKAEAARLFEKIAAIVERPAGKVRAELIPESSWKRSGERLRPTASQTVARLRRALSFAAAIFVNEQEAIRWLTDSHRMLGGATPYSLLRTEAGGRAVGDILAALEYGFSA